MGSRGLTVTPFGRHPSCLLNEKGFRYAHVPGTSRAFSLLAEGEFSPFWNRSRADILSSSTAETMIEVPADFVAGEILARLLGFALRIGGDKIRLVRSAPRGIVQGLTRSQMDELADAVRRGAGHIGDDIFVHGSRASGTARAASDIDTAVRVGPDEFDDLIRARFGTPNPGSAKERTMLHAIRTGKIHSGEAGLRGLRKQLEELLGFDVDISVIRRGGPFDQGPRIPLGGD